MTARLLAAPLLLLGLSTAHAQGYDRSQVQDRTFDTVTPLGVPPAGTANGGFETNGGEGSNVFAGWTVVDQSGGDGSWLAQTGTTTPVNGFTVPAPTQGAFAAMTEQGGPGSHVIYQDIVVPPGSSTLTFDLFLQNQASDYAVPDPASLDYTVTPNQQFRADIMSTAAGDFDVGAGVLANVYQTMPGDPLVSGYTTVSFDLSAFAGQAVRLRFAEVDNQNFFNVGIDNVAITSAGLGPVPQPNVIPSLDRTGLLALLALTALLGGWVLVRRRG